MHIVASMEPPGRDAGPASPSGHLKPQVMRRASYMKRMVGSLDTATAFQRHDADGSGAISRSELCAALMTAGLELDEQEIDGMFELLDKDASGSIDAEEFDAAYYAARLAGGIDIYIPVIQKMGWLPQQAMVAHLESDVFKQTLLYGWRERPVSAEEPLMLGSVAS